MGKEGTVGSKVLPLTIALIVNLIAELFRELMVFLDSKETWEKKD